MCTYKGKYGMLFPFQAEYFQDDLFPDTKVTWKAIMTSSEWFSGLNRLSKQVSLRPADMKLCKYYKHHFMLAVYYHCGHRVMKLICSKCAFCKYNFENGEMKM